MHSLFAFYFFPGDNGGENDAENSLLESLKYRFSRLAGLHEDKLNSRTIRTNLKDSNQSASPPSALEDLGIVDQTKVVRLTR